MTQLHEALDAQIRARRARWHLSAYRVIAEIFAEAGSRRERRARRRRRR